MTNERLLEKIHLVVEKLMNLGGCDYDKDKSVSSTDTKKGMGLASGCGSLRLI